MRLTEISIRALKAPEHGQITYPDDSLVGFGVRVSQGGTKTFVVVHGKRRQRTTIGRYPVISLQDARKVAKELLAERTLGRHVPIRSKTYSAALIAFLTDCEERIKEGRMKPRTLRDYKRLLNRHLSFGDEQLRDISPDDVMRKIDRLRRTPSEQRHAFTAASIFFRWAKRKRYVPHNPLDGEEVPSRPTSRKRVLVDDEVVKVYKAAADHPFGTIVRLIFLLGARRSEVANLRGEWIDPDERLITLPPSFTKNKRENILPYGPTVEAILDTLPRQGYLFPASRSHVRDKPTTVFNGWGKAKKALDTASDVDHWTLHDIRRVFKSSLAALKVEDHVSERLLGHISGISAMSRVYDRYAYLAEKRDAMSKWEAHLVGLLRN